MLNNYQNTNWSKQFPLLGSLAGDLASFGPDRIAILREMLQKN